MVKDISYKTATWNNWKEKENKVINGINKINSDLIIRFLMDMEVGLNVGVRTKKGGRSPARLNVLKNKLTKFIKLLEERGIKNITQVKEEELHKLVYDLHHGKIKRDDGKQYECPDDYVRNFKTFYHWWIKINRKKGIVIEDICVDLDSKSKENSFVYLTKEQVDSLINFEGCVTIKELTRHKLLKDKTYRWSYNERVLMKFLFDSIVRFPSEVLKIKVRNIYKDLKENIIVDINSDIGTKTPSSIRKFNLLLCGDEIQKYIEINQLKDDDFLFGFMKNQNYVYEFNKKLKIISKNLFGNGITIGGESYDKISGYDFRHCGSCYLRLLASRNGQISLDKIRQRGGWKDFDMLNYYTKLLGLDGVIDKELTLGNEDLSKYERRIEEQDKEISNMNKELKQIKKILMSLDLQQITLV